MRTDLGVCSQKGSPCLMSELQEPGREGLGLRQCLLCSCSWVRQCQESKSGACPTWVLMNLLVKEQKTSQASSYTCPTICPGSLFYAGCLRLKDSPYFLCQVYWGQVLQEHKSLWGPRVPPKMKTCNRQFWELLRVLCSAEAAHRLSLSHSPLILHYQVSAISKEYHSAS